MNTKKRPKKSFVGYTHYELFKEMLYYYPRRCAAQQELNRRNFIWAFKVYHEIAGLSISRSTKKTISKILSDTIEIWYEMGIEFGKTEFINKNPYPEEKTYRIVGFELQTETPISIQDFYMVVDIEFDNNNLPSGYASLTDIKQFFHYYKIYEPVA